MKADTIIVVPWHNPEQRDRFLEAWKVNGDEPFLVLQQDRSRAGCGATKNAGVAEAIARDAEIVVILDDDCFPEGKEQTLQSFAEAHEAALEPQDVTLCVPVTVPPSRGAPYFSRSVKMPVAASMGFWREIGDLDAASQLVRGARYPMTFRNGPIFGTYFPLCGMNLAFRPAEWLPWCQFIEVSRFDDIWMGWLWQKRAWHVGACFNLSGPLVAHSRQSNVWQNLRDEAKHLEANETLWRDIHLAPAGDYHSLLSCLPLE